MGTLRRQRDRAAAGEQECTGHFCNARNMEWGRVVVGRLMERQGEAGGRSAVRGLLLLLKLCRSCVGKQLRGEYR